MFEKAKAITIVRRMMLNSTELIEGAKEEGYLSSNYYSNAECALLSLAIFFADIYTRKDKLGKAILKEAVSGSWRQFISEEHKQDYKNAIENLASQYKNILYSTLSEPNFNDNPERIDNAFYEICKVFTAHFYAEFNEESAEYFMMILFGVKEYVYTLVGKK